jgi:hypothetical protein
MTSANNVDPSVSTTGSSSGTGSCVDEQCCSDGLTYDSTNNVCVIEESFVNYNTF